MKDRKAASICYALAIICWGVLTFCGIFDGKITSVIMYGICFVFSAVSLIVNIRALKKEACSGYPQKQKASVSK